MVNKRPPLKYSSNRHRFKVGDVVGVVGDCMCNCEILEIIPKKKGQSHSYIAKAVKISHPNPEETFFGKNEKFIVRDNEILVRLR